MKREDLLNGEIYAIDKEDSKQIFMFSGFSKEDSPYSILLECPNSTIDNYQPLEDYIQREELNVTKEYLASTGPKIEYNSIREATEKEKKYFKHVVHAAGYSINLETQTVTSYDNVEKEVIESSERKRNYDCLKKGDIYYFEIPNDVSVGYSIIIGQVEEVNGASVKLSAYAHQSDLKEQHCPIYESSVIVSPDFKKPAVDDWYRFSHSLIDVLENTQNKVKLSEKEAETVGAEEISSNKEKIEFLVNAFAVRLVEDVDRGIVVLVHRPETEFSKDAYFVYPPVSEMFYRPICEVTDIICKMFTDFYTKDDKDRNLYLASTFGEGRVVEKDEYDSAVDLLKVAREAEKEKQEQKISEVSSKNKASQIIKEEETREDEDETMRNPHKNFQFDPDTHIVYPGIYDSTMEAANDISITDDGFYIIINDLMSSEIVFKLTDDPHSVLHSRKLIHNAYTAVYGPLRDAEETFWFLINQLQKKYGYMYDSERGVLISPRANAEELIGAISELQENTLTPYGYAYRLFELPLNRLRDY